MSKLQNNITSLQNLLEQVNALPEAGGVELPKLTNEGTAVDLLSGKELIDDEGNIITGTFNLDNELNTQDDLIAQIQAAVDGLPEAGDGGSSSGSNETYTLELRGYNGDNLPVDCVYYYSNGKLCTYQSDGVAITQITINNIDVNTLVIIPYCPSFEIVNGSVTQLFSMDSIFYSNEANSRIILEIY